MAAIFKKRLGFAALCAGSMTIPLAMAEDVTISPEEPVTTSNVAALTAGDTLSLDDDTSIDLESTGQVGVTIDTNNSVSLDGAISAEDVDSVTGILVNSDISGSITNIGTISFSEDYDLEDIDEDGDLDADVNDNDVPDEEEGNLNSGYAVGSARTGIWLTDGHTLTGDIFNGIDSQDDDEDESASISIEGNDSFGIRIDGVLDGDLISSGSVGVYGDNSYGVRIGDGDGDVGVTGDVILDNVSVGGMNSVAVQIQDDVGGVLSIRGSLSASGYHSSSRPSDIEDYDDEDGIDYYELDADDKLQGGSALEITADIGGGIIIRGVGLEDDMDDDHDGVSEDDEDADESDDDLSGSIRVYGSAPAMDISGAHIGALSYDFSINTLALDAGSEFGLYNRGSIYAYGIYNDVTATGVSITGGSLIDGGILNDGAITVAAYNANAYGIYLEGSAAGQIVNRNSITASTTSDSTTPDGYVSDDVAADDTAYAIYIGAGSQVTSINNAGSLRAYGADTDANTTNEANATAIADRSNTLASIVNSGVIQATAYISYDDTEDDLEPEAGGKGIAIDVSTSTIGVTLTQIPNQINEDDGPDADEEDDDDSIDAVQDIGIVGDILFGSGDDVVDMRSGVIAGELSFGLGADTFLMDGDSTYVGRLSDSDGQLTIGVQDGDLYLTNDTADGAVNITSATFGSNSLLGIDLAVSSAESVSLNASGAISFSPGAQLLLSIPQGLPENGAATIVTAAGGLDAAAVVGEVTTEGTSFLYRVFVDYPDGDANALEANYRLKTADELALNRNQATIYTNLLAALRLDEDASDAMTALSDEASFFDAYDDLMPSFSSAAAEILTTAIARGQSASANRLSATRLNALREVSVWGQEIGYAVRRTPNQPYGQEYDGGGFGFAFGIDGPLKTGQMFGLSAALVASEVLEDGRPEAGEIAVSILQGNAYLGTSLGAIDLDFVGGVGVGQLKSERQVEIGDDFDARAEAKWWAGEGHGSIQASAPLNLADWLVLSPRASLTYVALYEDGYTETGGGAAIDYDVDSAFSQRLWVDAGLELSPRFRRSGGSIIAPRLYVGYRANVLDEAAERTVRFVSGGTDMTLIDDQNGEGGPLFGLGVDATDGYSSFSLSYEGEFGEQIERHSINAAVRYRF